MYVCMYIYIYVYACVCAQTNTHESFREIAARRKRVKVEQLTLSVTSRFSAEKVFFLGNFIATLVFMLKKKF